MRFSFLVFSAATDPLDELGQTLQRPILERDRDWFEKEVALRLPRFDRAATQTTDLGMSHHFDPSDAKRADEPACVIVRVDIFPGLHVRGAGHADSFSPKAGSKL
jgi:hypothetical protein